MVRLRRPQLIRITPMAEVPLSTPTTGRVVVIEAQPNPLRIDTAQAAVLVIDMQNDFGAKGGMFDRAGIDISMIQRAVDPTARVLTAARQVGIPVVYLKMAFRPTCQTLPPWTPPTGSNICPSPPGRRSRRQMARPAASSSGIPGT